MRSVVLVSLQFAKRCGWRQPRGAPCRENDDTEEEKGVCWASFAEAKPPPWSTESP